MREVAEGNQEQNMESEIRKRGCEAANLKGLLPHWGSHFVAQTVSPRREFEEGRGEKNRTSVAPDVRTRDGANEGGGLTGVKRTTAGGYARSQGRSKEGF